MGYVKFSIKELPLGIVLPEDPYNQHVCRALAAMDESPPNLAEIEVIEEKRRAIWQSIQKIKDQGMVDFAQHVARQYEFPLKSDGSLDYPWQTDGFVRIDYDSQFYTCDPTNKAFKAVELDPDKPKIVLFATGRAFAQRNARLLNLSSEEALKNARYVMSAQTHLLRSRLVPKPGRQVFAMAYDMVLSEFETPALRLQSILDPDYIHEVSRLSAERVFGPLIADAEMTSDGLFQRVNGKIQGRALNAADIIHNIQGTVLAGGSIGCVIAAQASHCLSALLEELKVESGVIDDVMKSFLLFNFGPTTHLKIDPRSNHFSVINHNDEFVFAGHNVAPLIQRSKAAGLSLLPDRPDGDPSQARHWTQVIDGPGVSFPGADGELVFDPDATHFGHNLKQYMNNLRDRGFAHLFERVFENKGPFCLGEMIESLKSDGLLKVAL
jgi:hypothetical protein